MPWTKICSLDQLLRKSVLILVRVVFLEYYRSKKGYRGMKIKWKFKKSRQSAKYVCLFVFKLLSLSSATTLPKLMEMAQCQRGPLAQSCPPLSSELHSAAQSSHWFHVAPDLSANPLWASFSHSHRGLILDFSLGSIFLVIVLFFFYLDNNLHFCNLLKLTQVTWVNSASIIGPWDSCLLPLIPLCSHGQCPACITRTHEYNKADEKWKKM